MAKKKMTGPDTPAESAPAAPRRRTTPGRKAPRPKAVRPDPGVAEPGVTPPAEPLNLAPDRTVGTGSGDNAAAREPSHDEIAEAAYQRYLRRGGQHGHDWSDWLEAERDLRARKGQQG